MLVVDVETTGLNPLQHSIISIGAVDFNNPQRSFYAECRPWAGAEVTDQALAVNGFSREQLTACGKSLAEALTEFVDWCRQSNDCALAGETIAFDHSFLISSLERFQMEVIFGKRLVDLHALSYTHHLKRGVAILLDKNRSALNLDATLAYVGLPVQPKPRNALTDAELEAFSRLITGYNLLKDYQSSPVPDYL